MPGRVQCIVCTNYQQQLCANSWIFAIRNQKLMAAQKCLNYIQVDNIIKHNKWFNFNLANCISLLLLFRILFILHQFDAIHQQTGHSTTWAYDSTHFRRWARQQQSVRCACLNGMRGETFRRTCPNDVYCALHFTRLCEYETVKHIEFVSVSRRDPSTPSRTCISPSAVVILTI